VVTKCFPEHDRQFIAFETGLQKIIGDLDRSHPAGWIVDLRGNVGGNMWPMLAGIGPVLGEGDDLGEFFTLDSHSTWKYRDGVAADANNVITLSDGASMWLTIGVDADRTGKKYLDGLGPDEEIVLGNQILADDRDPVLLGALRWLNAAAGR